MKITKDELIAEIEAQLTSLGLVADAMDSFDLMQTLTIFDLQFRLKSKLYELTNDKE